MTQKRLKQLLDYNPDTGIFTRLTNGGGRKIGDMSGTVSGGGYISIRIKTKQMKAHRLAFLYMTGDIPEFVDHINHKVDDNRWCNLREVTHQDNCKNRKIRKDNSSGVVGVRWNKAKKSWVADISTPNGDVIYLGAFSVFSEAVNVRKLAEVTYGYHENHGKDL